MTTERTYGEPAFPRDHAVDGHNGMTLRDYFAAKAMQGYIAGEYDVYPYEIPIKAYKMADIMLEERRK